MSGGLLGDSNLALAPPPINCCEEPFRIFFPIGALLAVLGVSLWPLYYSGAFAEYPCFVHHWLSWYRKSDNAGAEVRLYEARGIVSCSTAIVL